MALGTLKAGKGKLQGFPVPYLDRFMTLPAGDCPMCASQREARFLMVYQGKFTGYKSRFRMADITVGFSQAGRKLPLMVIFMAIPALLKL